MCAVPKVKMPGGSDSETRVLKVVDCCPESPVIGGNHKAPSKFCQLHNECPSNEKDAVLTVPEHLAFRKLDENVNLPRNEDNTLFAGCKKAKNVNRFHDRTAGVLALVRPCGII